MKVSEVTVEILSDYLRLDDPTEIERAEISRMMVSARHYIKARTGLSDEGVDANEDITAAFFILVADQFDNRNMLIETKASSQNPAVAAILDMHAVNLL